MCLLLSVIALSVASCGDAPKHADGSASSKSDFTGRWVPDVASTVAHARVHAFMIARAEAPSIEQLNAISETLAEDIRKSYGTSDLRLTLHEDFNAEWTMSARAQTDGGTAKKQLWRGTWKHHDEFLIAGLVSADEPAAQPWWIMFVPVGDRLMTYWQVQSDQGGIRSVPYFLLKRAQ